jgi:hypothetical protein
VGTLVFQAMVTPEDEVLATLADEMTGCGSPSLG